MAEADDREMGDHSRVSIGEHSPWTGEAAAEKRRIGSPWWPGVEYRLCLFLLGNSVMRGGGG